LIVRKVSSSQLPTIETANMQQNASQKERAPDAICSRIEVEF